MGNPRTDPTLAEKPCSYCGEIQPVDLFRWVTPRPGRGRPHWASICKPCDRESSRDWRANNVERSRAAVRRWKLENRCGLTPEQYDKLVTAQEGLCAICQRPPSTNNKNHARLKVDHDHTTGLVRGLLCNRCNLELGWLEANREAIERYLAAAAAIPS